MRPADLFVISRNTPRSTAIFWTVAGAISVTLAIWVAMQPGRLIDFWTVREWLLMWPEAGLLTSPKVRAAVVGLAIALGVGDIPRGVLWIADSRDELSWLAHGSYDIRPVWITVMLGFLMYSPGVRRQFRSS